MDNLGFRMWLSEIHIKKKVISDIISRLKHVERELGNMDLDELYDADFFDSLYSLFINQGQKLEYLYPNAKLPNTKYQLNNYKHAIYRYASYKNTKV
jgi:hypothetical protein